MDTQLSEQEELSRKYENAKAILWEERQEKGMAWEWRKKYEVMRGRYERLQERYQNQEKWKQTRTKLDQRKKYLPSFHI